MKHKMPEIHFKYATFLEDEVRPAWALGLGRGQVLLQAQNPALSRTCHGCGGTRLCCTEGWCRGQEAGVRGVGG